MHRAKPQLPTRTHSKSRPGDALFTRWCLVGRYTPDELAQLHRIEKEDAESRRRYHKREIDREAVSSRAASFMWQLDESHGPYWPRLVSVDAREAALNAFKRSIYPIWAAQWAKVDAGYDKMPGDEGYYPEPRAIHNVDMAIQRLTRRTPQDFVGAVGGMRV